MVDSVRGFAGGTFIRVDGNVEAPTFLMTAVVVVVFPISVVSTETIREHKRLGKNKSGGEGERERDS